MKAVDVCFQLVSPVEGGCAVVALERLGCRVDCVQVALQFVLTAEAGGTQAADVRFLLQVHSLHMA